jgi:hypothetical protein
MNRQVNIRSLGDAKARKPGALREFSLEFSTHWDRLVYAQLRFLNAVYECADDWKNASVRKRRHIGYRLGDIAKEIRRSDAFKVTLDDAHGPENDRIENGILASFLILQAVPFVEFWKEAIEALDNGVSLKIKPRDIPIWFGEVPGYIRTVAVSQ